MTQSYVPNLPAYTVGDLFYHYVIYVDFVCFLPEGSMLDIDCIDSDHRLSLSKFWGFPKREELEILHCD